MELSYSSLSEFITCPRRGENLLVHGRKGAFSTVAKSFGGCLHKLEEIRLRNGWSDDTKHKQLAHITQHFQDNPVPLEEYRNADRMVDLISTYNKRYALPSAPLFDDWPNRVVQYEGQPLIERPFKYPLVSIPINASVPYLRHQLIYDDDAKTPDVYFGTVHVILIGIVDLVIRDQGNLLWVVDHKTASQGGGEFLSWFRLSLQTRLYVLALRDLLSLDIKGLYLNGVVYRKPTKTGVPFDWERHPYIYSPDMLEDARRSYISACEDLLHCLSRGFFPQTSRSFRSPCSGCAYHDNCSLPLAQRPADLATSIYEDNTTSGMDDGPASE